MKSIDFHRLIIGQPKIAANFRYNWRHILFYFFILIGVLFGWGLLFWLLNINQIVQVKSYFINIKPILSGIAGPLIGAWLSWKAINYLRITQFVYYENGQTAFFPTAPEMDSHESLIAGHPEREDNWIKTGLKVELTKEEQRKNCCPSSPRRKFFLVFYQGKSGWAGNNPHPQPTRPLAEHPSCKVLHRPIGFGEAKPVRINTMANPKLEDTRLRDRTAQLSGGQPRHQAGRSKNLWNYPSTGCILNKPFELLETGQWNLSRLDNTVNHSIHCVNPASEINLQGKDQHWGGCLTNED